jgi:hypothetical protein
MSYRRRAEAEPVARKAELVRSSAATAAPSADGWPSLFATASIGGAQRPVINDAALVLFFVIDRIPRRCGPFRARASALMSSWRSLSLLDGEVSLMYFAVPPITNVCTITQLTYRRKF